MLFDEFYRNFGLSKYPFSTYTAESELDKLEQLFVQPASYSPIRENIESGAPAFIYGERGTGKTALLKEVTSRIERIEIDNYSSIPLESTKEKFYELFLNNLSKPLILKLSQSPIKKLQLSHEEKILISYLLKYHTQHTTVQLAYENIKNIQHGLFKRIGLYVFNAFRGTANSAASAIVDIASDAVLKHFNVPSTSNFEVREYFKELKLEKVEDPEKSSECYHILKKSLALYRKIHNKKATFTLDKIDEDFRFDNDADTISEFIKPLFTDNQFLLDDDIQIIISIWSIPFNRVLPSFRKNKFCCEEIRWEKQELQSLIDKRIQKFSDGKIQDIVEILGNKESFDDLYEISNGNPRDLIQVLNQVFREQFKKNSKSTLISELAIKDGITNFVRNFSFYEYYPKKSNARKNSMDVYSYISHLQKLDGITFTQNRLSERAATGGSTSNYIVGMEGIGLVVRCEEKGPNGSTLYKIRDPKVVHAIQEKIEIRRER